MEGLKPELTTRERQSKDNQRARGRAWKRSRLIAVVRRRRSAASERRKRLQQQDMTAEQADAAGVPVILGGVAP